MKFRFTVTGLKDDSRTALLNVLASEPIDVVHNAEPLELDVPPERFDFVVAAVSGYPEASYEYKGGPKD